MVRFLLAISKGLSNNYSCYCFGEWTSKCCNSLKMDSKLPTGLPRRLVAAVLKIAKQTGDQPIVVLRKAVKLYGKQVFVVDKPKALKQDSVLRQITSNEQDLEAFQRVVKAMAAKTNAAMTQEAKIERAQKGAKEKHLRWLKRTSTDRKEP